MTRRHRRVLFLVARVISCNLVTVQHYEETVTAVIMKLSGNTGTGRATNSLGGSTLQWDMRGNICCAWHYSLASRSMKLMG